MDICFNIIEDQSNLYIEDTTIYKEDRNSLPYNSFLEEDTVKLELLIQKTSNNMEGKLIQTSNSGNLQVTKDGWYKIVHLVLPTFSWLQTVSGKILDYYNNIYVWSNSQVYKYVDHQLKQVDILELLEINQNSRTTVNYSSKEIFNISNLEKCVVNLNNMNIKDCGNKQDPCEKKNCRRNHVHHLINIINYYVHCGDIHEALSLLESFNSCFEFCKSESNNYGKCGCYD